MNSEILRTLENKDSTFHTIVNIILLFHIRKPRPFYHLGTACTGSTRSSGTDFIAFLEQ